MKFLPLLSLPLLFCALVVAHAATSTVLPNPPMPPRHRPPSPPQAQPPRATGNFGDPLPGLTKQQLSDFTDGLAEFETVETVESGLGPIFNNVSCVSCHSGVATGSGSKTTVTRFGRTTNGVFDPLTELGGSLLQSQAIDPQALEVIPVEANVIAQRQTTPLFGAGLIEAIQDQDIQQLARVHRPDGIKGRAAMITDVSTGKLRVGRYGWKSQHAVLLSFAGDAYVNEMGITNRFFPTENAPNGNLQILEEFDHVADPEDVTDPVTGLADIDRLANFMRLLAPPPQVPLSMSARAGADLFTQLGCAQCHQPTFVTGPSPIAALNRRLVPLFSDLLLHDMGTLNDGIAMGDAGTNEMKTAPLWGLRVRTTFLHDGRALTVDDAIRAHDGEGAKARDRYIQRPAAQQQHLIDFLNSI